MEKREKNPIWRGLILIQKAIMLITGTATVLLVFIPLLMREFNRPFVGSEEFLLVFAFWMYMMGSSYGSYEKSQITADIMDMIIKPGIVRDSIVLLKYILTLILGIIFAYWALILIQWSFETGTTTSIYKIPIVIGQSSILLSLILSSVYNFAYAYDYICYFIQKYIKKLDVISPDDIRKELTA